MITRIIPKAGPCVAALAAVLVLSACQPGTNGAAPTADQVAATASADAAALQGAINVAINLYQIDKGIALVAAPADPTLLADIAAADAIVAKIQAINTAAAGAQPAINQLIAQLISQANTLTAKAAPAVTVVPKGSVPAKS